jgi:hypothetical protein
MVKAYYVAKGLLAGTCVAFLISIVLARGLKPILWICGLLFVIFNVFIVTLDHFRNGFTFYSINANLVGAAITLAILHFQHQQQTEKNLAG